jgi:hypothetical protein
MNPLKNVLPNPEDCRVCALFLGFLSAPLVILPIVAATMAS